MPPYASLSSILIYFILTFVSAAVSFYSNASVTKHKFCFQLCKTGVHSHTDPKGLVGQVFFTVHEWLARDKERARWMRDRRWKLGIECHHRPHLRTATLLLLSLTLFAKPAMAQSDVTFDVNFRVTSHIKGSSFPVDRWGTECSRALLNASPCSCYGGAARRHTFLADGDGVGEKITLDAGEHISGSGLFFPTLRGNASGSFFNAAGYDAVGLGYADFMAFVTPSDPSGAHGLARFLQRHVQHAVATSFNFTDTPRALCCKETCCRAIAPCLLPCVRTGRS